MSVEFKIIGFTDSINDCDCCGRSELKGTYCVSIDGNEFYYGVTCASKHTGLNDKQIKLEVKKINTVAEFDLLMSESKSEYAKTKTLRLAIKKGYNKDEFFLKHGVLIQDFSDEYEKYYSIGIETHSICKS